jgi:hypothetical protein
MFVVLNFLTKIIRGELIVCDGDFGVENKVMVFPYSSPLPCPKVVSSCIQLFSTGYTHSLGVNKRADMFEFTFKCVVSFNFFFYFFT